uniref:Secreted protein n=1 Tax=Eutreptiella gymnastica TaxID=73025 RepID=A0A7S1ISR7_9EUGL
MQEPRRWLPLRRALECCALLIVCVPYGKLCGARPCPVRLCCAGSNLLDRSAAEVGESEVCVASSFEGPTCPSDQQAARARTGSKRAQSNQIMLAKQFWPVLQGPHWRL